MNRLLFIYNTFTSFNYKRCQAYIFKLSPIFFAIFLKNIIVFRKISRTDEKTSSIKVIDMTGKEERILTGYQVELRYIYKSIQGYVCL